MEDKRLRAQVAKALNRDDVPDSTWDVLQDKGFVADASISPAASKELIDFARALLPYGDLMDAPPSIKRERKKPKELGEGIGEHELVRARAMGAGIAYACALDTRVRDFRKRVLNGKLLEPEVAQAFAESPATARFPVHWFEEQGVPVTQHHSDVSSIDVEYDSEEDEERDVHFVEVEYVSVSPPGKAFKASLPRSVYFFDLPVARVSCRPADDPEAGFDVFQRVYPRSVMDELRILSMQLVEEEFCRPWDEADVAGFILTGIANVPKVLIGGAEEHRGSLSAGTITLTVDPCVAPDTVRQMYETLQLNVLNRNRNARPPAPRNMEVFKFVMEQMTEHRMEHPSTEAQSGVPLIPWRELKERWNASHPEEVYTDSGQFKRDYHRALHVLRSEKDPFEGRWRETRSIP